MADYSQKIVIAGAGVSGLSAGIYLKRRGYHNITFIEASDRVGGRMKTEKIDGYTLNVGFHTLFTAYPYAQDLLDFESLNLQYLDSGALIIKNHKLKKILDPFKHPLKSIGMILSPMLTIFDKINLVRRRVEIKHLTENQIFEKFEVKTSSILKKKKYSNKIIKNLFKPLLSGIFLENELTTSRRIFDYTFKMLMEGKVAIPLDGIESIPKQLAENFTDESFLFNKKVKNFKDNTVFLEDGTTLKADIFILATHKNELFAQLKNEPYKNDHLSTTCLYFTSNSKPFKEPILCVNSNDPKLVNNVMVYTNLSKKFAPSGKELISVSINGLAKADDKKLEMEVKAELEGVFKKNIDDWKLIKTYRIDYALPEQTYVLGKRQLNEMRFGKNGYLCGDHLLYGSMNAAMKTGKMISEIIHRDFNLGHKLEKKKRFDELFDIERELK